MDTEPAPASGRRATQARHHALHDALIAAGEAAVARDGLDGLRARALAKAVGCSVGAIYAVFPDLDALVLAVNARTLEAIGAVLHRSEDARGTDGHRPDAALERLACAYLDFVTANGPRCAALFTHRMAQGRAVPDAYVDQQARVFAHVERPLAELRPDLAPAERLLLARTLFSAVHGMVTLGLDQKLAAIAPATLRAQLRLVVGAIATGLAAGG